MKARLGVVCTSARDASVGRARQGADNFLICESGRASWLADGSERSERSDGVGTLLAVADGDADEVEDARTASASLCRVLAKFWAGGERPEPALAMSEFLQSAHTRMYWKTQGKGVRMSASCAVAWLLHGKAHWVEIGSARVYVWSRGRGLQRVARPWGRIQEQRFLSGSVGLGDDSALHMLEGINVGSVALAPGDTVLLCTDGLWQVVDDPSVTQILQHVDDPQTAAVTLMERSLARGAADHVTVLVATAAATQPPIRDARTELERPEPLRRSGVGTPAGTKTDP